MDERSLIKKYQREINELRQELELLRASMLEQQPVPDLRASPSAGEEDLTALRQQVRFTTVHCGMAASGQIEAKLEMLNVD